MRPLRCPWCDHELGFPARLGERRSANKPRWYQLTRTVSTCPYCAQPVRPAPSAQRWLLLEFPLILALSAQALLLHPWPALVLWLLGATAAAGLVGYRLAVRLERVHGA